MLYTAPVLQQKPLANRLNLHCTVFSQAMGKTERILRTVTEMKKNKVKYQRLSHQMRLQEVVDYVILLYFNSILPFPL